MKYCFSAIALLCVFLASSSWAGQKICASPPENSRATLELPGRMENTLLIQGDPSVRFLIRFEWICRKGHIYREAGEDLVEIPLGDCFQPGKMHVSVRKGCGIFEINSQRSSGRSRR